MWRAWGLACITLLTFHCSNDNGNGMCGVMQCPPDLACTSGCQPGDMACTTCQPGADLACGGGCADLACGGGCGDMASTCMSQSCGGGTVDTCSSGSHCGVCGHDCQGGACVGGVCQATSVITARYAPWGVAVDSSNVYWTDSGSMTMTDGSVQSQAKSGGAATPVATTQWTPRPIVVAGGALYWANYNAGEIWRQDLPPVAAKVNIVTAPSTISTFAVGGSDVFYPAGTVIRAAPITGGGATRIVTPAVVGQLPGALTTDGAFVYWTNQGDNTISKTPVSGGAATTLVPSANAGLVMYFGGDVYFTTTMTIQKVAAGGGSPAPVVSGLASSPSALAVDADGVYWTHTTLGKVVRARFAGGGAVEVASGQTNVEGIAVDATTIYWATNGTPLMMDGTIMKAAK